MSKKTGKVVECANCKKEVYKSGARIKRSKELFCSKECFDKFRLDRIITWCQVCRKEIKRVPSHMFRKSKYTVCSRKCLSIAWKGINHSGYFKKGNTLDKCINYKEGRQDCNGYKMLLLPDHPERNSKGYVYEHRVVMEESLGRKLTNKEVVHHINKDKTDNRIDNLMLFEDNVTHLNYHKKNK